MSGSTLKSNKPIIEGKLEVGPAEVNEGNMVWERTKDTCMRTGEEA